MAFSLAFSKTASPSGSCPANVKAALQQQILSSLSSSRIHYPPRRSWSNACACQSSAEDDNTLLRLMHTGSLLVMPNQIGKGAVCVLRTDGPGRPDAMPAMAFTPGSEGGGLSVHRASASCWGQRRAASCVGPAAAPPDPCVPPSRARAPAAPCHALIMGRGDCHVCRACP